jgi:hypothetical protein
MGGAAASPLAVIERAVQERAKDISLEMSAPGGEVKLRALIADEVGRWNEDHRRGRRAFALPDPELVVERAFRNLARYGPLTALLADDDVWEVMVNAPDAVFVRRHRGLSGYHDEVFHDDDHVVRVLTKLLDDASSAHRSLDPAEGLQDAQLDDGARVHIVHGDIARGGHVLVNIRTRSGPWASWSGRFHRRARCGGGFERFHCRGRRGGVFRAGSGGFGGRVPAAVRALPPALRGLSLVPPSVGAEPPGRSWFNHRHPLGAQNPWCQHLGSGALACCDPAEPDNADLGAAATLRGSQARGT